MTSPQDGEEPGLPAPEAAAPAEPPPAQPIGQYWQPAPPPPQLYPPPMNQIAPQRGYPPQFYPARPGTNAFAIVAFVTSLVFFVLGPIFGFIALNQIKRTGEQGRGFALAGIWIGFASAAFFVLWIIFIVTTFRQFEQPIPLN
ncbi:MAG TPA: DUF4190 domain-containing protein [Pseudonocardiaceae bacterium]|nr:DUF4190 domain-containing protein [Pseudonocardiaceae bacterium]